MTNEVKICLIVARGRNGIIGREGQLPWRLRDDQLFFKEVTGGNPIIMGRKTWESLPVRPLPGRANIVLTRDWTYAADGARVYSAFNVAAAAARAMAAREGRSEVFVMGGVSVYERALPMADRLYLTEVDAAPEGDVSFPDFDESEWREISTKQFEADARNDHAFTIRQLNRI